jgi:hypothetical protein
MVIQQQVDLIGTPGHGVRIVKFSIGEMTASSIPLSMEARLNPFTFLPIRGGINPTTIHVFSGDLALFDINLPATSFMVNQEIPLSIPVSVTFTPEQKSQMQTLLSQLSSERGMPSFPINIRLNAPLTLFGIQMYAGLPLQRNINLGAGDLTFKTLMDVASKPLNQNLVFVNKNTFNGDFPSCPIFVYLILISHRCGTQGQLFSK